MKIVNESLRFFNQQGRRPGSAAIYLEPWHKDIFDLLDIKKNTGAEELRARDLFTALWIPDNFMRAVKNNDDWYLFCPNDIKKVGIKPLQECYDKEYEENYNRLVSLGIGKKVRAQDIWNKIIESQIETGVPYLCSKDNANKKTNHQNIGVIRQSNLCNEIVEYSDSKEYAVCNLASISLRHFVKPFINEKSNKWIIYSKPNCKYCNYAKKYLQYHKYGFQEVSFSQENLDKLNTQMKFLTAIKALIKSFPPPLPILSTNLR